MRLRPAGCVHHHRNKGNLVGKGKASEGKHCVSSLHFLFCAIYFAISRKWVEGR